jgi:hypothetical protein
MSLFVMPAFSQGEYSWALQNQVFQVVPEEDQATAAAAIMDRIRELPAGEPAVLKPLYDELISRCPTTSEAKRAMFATVNLYQEALTLAPSSSHTDIEKIRIQQSATDGIARIAALYLARYPAMPGNSGPLEKERLMQQWMIRSLINLGKLKEAAEHLASYLNVHDDQLAFRDLLLLMTQSRLYLALNLQTPARNALTRVIDITGSRNQSHAMVTLHKEANDLRNETDLLFMLGDGERIARIRNMIQSRESMPSGQPSDTATATVLLYPPDTSPDLLWLKRELTRLMTGN